MVARKQKETDRKEPVQGKTYPSRTLPLPPIKPHILKFPVPFKTVTTAGDQAFNT
jgi:hypothetical protein